MRVTGRLLSLAATVCFAAEAFASDQVVRDDAHHFSFRRPDASGPLDAAFLDGFRARVSEARSAVEAAVGRSYDWTEIASFGIPLDEDGGEITRVCVSFIRWPLRPRSYRGIEWHCSREMRAAGAVLFGDPAGTESSEHEDVVVDRSRGRFSSRGTVTSAAAGDVATYTIGLPGKEGLVCLVASARPTDAAVAWPLVDGVADSFRWDDGYEFREEVVAGASTGPGTWRDDSHRWSVTVPAGWTRRRPEAGDGERCVSTFAPVGGERGLDPAVVAAWFPGDLHDASWSEFKDVFLGKDFERSFSDSVVAIGRTSSKVEWSRAVFDRHSGRMSMTSSMEFAGLRWRFVLVIRFGRDGAALLLCQAMERDFAAAQPAFDELVGSFRFDDGSGWEDAFPFASVDWGSVGETAVVVAGLGLLGAAILRIVRVRQAKAAHARARERLLRDDLGGRRD